MIRFLVEAEATAGTAALSSSMCRPEPGAAGAQPRRLRGDDLRAARDADLDGRRRRHRTRPGGSACIPRGTVHRFENVGTEAATQLAVVTPGLLGAAFFRDLAAVFNVDGPPDLAAALDVMRRHGLTPAM